MRNQERSGRNTLHPLRTLQSIQGDLAIPEGDKSKIMRNLSSVESNNVSVGILGKLSFEPAATY